MEDFFFAGGLRALLAKLGDQIDGSARTIEGRSLGEAIAGAECFDDDVIRSPDKPVIPLSRGATLAVLRGNLCPDGAVIKTSAANPALLRHTGPALVFDSHAELSARRATALAEIGEAKRAIASSDDCTETCPLLVTLQTGVDHLCALREGQDDAARCKEARTDLTATDARVKKSCDGCKPARLDDDVDAAL